MMMFILGFAFGFLGFLALGFWCMVCDPATYDKRMRIAKARRIVARRRAMGRVTDMLYLLEKE